MQGPDLYVVRYANHDEFVFVSIVRTHPTASTFDPSQAYLIIYWDSTPEDWFNEIKTSHKIYYLR